MKIASDLDVQNMITRSFIKPYDTGVLPSGKDLTEQLKKSRDINLNIDDVVRQSAMRYNNLFATKLTIAIFGDFGLHPGDLIHCDFPEVSDKKDQDVSYRKSGLYMIVDMCHFIRLKPRQSFTRLNLVRESIGRKPF